MATGSFTGLYLNSNFLAVMPILPTIDWKRTETWLVSLLVFIGFGFSFALLPASSIWLDEAFSIKLASESFSSAIASLRTDNGSPLFYFLLHGWIRLFGTGEYVCTLMTVLTTCASLLATVLFLREVFTDPRIRITGIALTALSTACLHHATNLRSYSLLILLSVLSYLFFYRAIRLGRRREWVLFALASILGLYEHPLYAFVPMAQFLLLCLFYRDRFKAGLLAFVATGIAYLPWFPVLLAQAQGYQGGTTPDTIPRLSTYGGPAHAYWLSISSRMWNFSAFDMLLMWTAPLAVLFIVYLLWRSRCRTLDDRHARDFLLAHLFSVGLMVAISLVRPIFWLGKFDLIGLPLVCGMIGYAVSRLPRSSLVITAFLAVNLAGTLRYAYWRITGHLDSQREVIEQLAPKLKADDVLIETGLSHFEVEYYLGQLGVKTGLRCVFPEAQRDRPACLDQDRLVREHDAVTAEAAALMQRLKAGNGGFIYVFHSSYEGLGPLYKQLNAAFALERVIPVRCHPWGPTYTQVDVFRRH